MVSKVKGSQGASKSYKDSKADGEREMETATGEFLPPFSVAESSELSLSALEGPCRRKE